MSILPSPIGHCIFWNFMNLSAFSVQVNVFLQYGMYFISLHHFFCSSGKCFGWWWSGFASLVLDRPTALCLGTKCSGLPFPPLVSPALSFSLFHAPVFLISQLPFPVNEGRNASDYFPNLGWGEVPVERQCDWQGSVLEWLRGSLLASDSHCWQPRLRLQYRAGKPENKNNTGQFLLEWISPEHLAFLPFFHLPLCLNLCMCLSISSPPSLLSVYSLFYFLCVSLLHSLSSGIGFLV